MSNNNSGGGSGIYAIILIVIVGTVLAVACYLSLVLAGLTH